MASATVASYPYQPDGAISGLQVGAPAAPPNFAVTTQYATPVQTTYQSTTFSMEENLYRPENSEFVPPGRPLRGGMTPLYDMTQVRTFEAFPSFQTAAIVQNRGIGSELVSEAASAPGSKAFRATPPSTLKKRMLCC